MSINTTLNSNINTLLKSKL